MAGTYKCTVTGIGGQNSGSGTLDVYCKSYTITFHTNYFCKRQSNLICQYIIMADRESESFSMSKE